MKFDVKKYATLARINLTQNEEEEISNDIGDILDYFKELQELDIKNTKPVIGGTNLKNIFREDKKEESTESSDEFPLSDGGYLKVPKVFE